MGSGSSTPVGTVLGASTTAAGLTVLPQTGMNNVVEIALAAAAGLLVWGIVYFRMTKSSQRA